MSRGDEKTLTITFADLGTLPEIAEALERNGITAPFPIQEMAVPIGLTGTDLIAQARTGTGKTLAFGVPLLQRIVSRHDRDYADVVEEGKPQALVVAPTRELALQVTEDLNKAGALRETRTLTIYGGVPYETQLGALKSGVDVVIGTPGRLLDLANRRALDLSHVKVLVLDEADRMLDLGFLPDVERLIKLTHELRQTMLFSATMPGDIVQLARRHMRRPVNVRAESADEGQTVPATAQFVYRAHDLDKPEVLAKILQAEDRGRAVVFCTTKRQAQRVNDDLADRGFSVASIHGDLGQVQRERALDRFRNGKIDVLVATDVAARGIDVEGVTHVINYTCPDDEKTYVHRIGRTGRAGASGIAVTFVDWPDTARWKMINKTLDLPFDAPVETYSTSDHLFSDLGIPKDATGRAGPPRGTPPKADREDREDRGSRGPRGRTSGRESGRDRARPGRGSRGRDRDSDRDSGRVGDRASDRTGDRSDRRADHRADHRAGSDVVLDGESADSTESGRERTKRTRIRTRRRSHDEPTDTHSDSAATDAHSDARATDTSADLATDAAKVTGNAREATTAPDAGGNGDGAGKSTRARSRRRMRAGVPVDADSPQDIAAGEASPSLAEDSPVREATTEASPAEEKPKRKRTTKKSAPAAVDVTDAEPTPEAKPKRRTTKKSAAADADVASAAATDTDTEAATDAAPATEATEEKPKRRRTTKKTAEAAANPAVDVSPAVDVAAAEAVAEEKPKRKRTTKKAAASQSDAATEVTVAVDDERPKRRRTTKKVAAAEPKGVQPAVADSKTAEPVVAEPKAVKPVYQQPFATNTATAVMFSSPDPK